MLPHTHLLPDHAAACGVRKVEVVVMADEGLGVSLSELSHLWGGMAWLFLAALGFAVG